MKSVQQWGQILLGAGLGLLIGAVTSFVRQDIRAATAALLLAVLCVCTGLYLMRRGGRR